MSAHSGGNRLGESAATGEAWFRTLFDSSPDPAWIIENHHFVECNEAAIRALGYRSRDDYAKAESLGNPPGN
jgi:PAS domain-containing protein